MGSKLNPLLKKFFYKRMLCYTKPCYALVGLALPLSRPSDFSATGGGFFQENEEGARMHPEKVKRRRRRHAAVSCLCALALALGTAVPYLAWAEGEVVDQPALEVSDAPAPDDGALPETGPADGGEALGGLAVEEEAADAAVEGAEGSGADAEGAGQGDTDPAEDGSEVDGAETGTAEPEGDAEAGSEGAEQASDGDRLADGGAVAPGAEGDAPAQAPDAAAEEVPAEATLTFYGPSKTEKKVPAGMTLTAVDLPSAPATCTFEAWGGGTLEGTFVGWYKGAMRDGRPALYEADADDDKVHAGPNLWGTSFWNSDMCVGQSNFANFQKAEGTAVKEDTAFFPAYRVEYRTVVFEIAVQNKSDNMTTGGGDFVLDVPEDYVFTKAEVKLLVDHCIERGKRMGWPPFMGFYEMKGFGQGGAVPSGGPLGLSDLVGKSPWSFTDTDLADLLVVYGYGDPYDVGEDAEDEGPALTVTGGTGIKASGKLSGPNVPEGADIEVGTSKVTSGAAYDDLDAAVPDRIGDIFEITLLVNGKEIHDGFGELTISMPVGAGYNGHIIVIYHRHQDGSITTSRAVVRDGYVTFTVTDLSAFALADGGLPADEGDGGAAAATGPDDDGEKADAGKAASRGPLAQTGDAAPVLALIALASAAAGAAVFAGLGARGRHGRHVRR